MTKNREGRTRNGAPKGPLPPEGLLPPEGPHLVLRFKLWLDRGGKAFGEGPLRLLQLVGERGSLRQAAAELNMSYNKAWRLLKTMEARLGFDLIERSVGGVSGGGSRLTPAAEAMVSRYRAMRDEAAQALAAIFERHFGAGLPEAESCRKEEEAEG